MSPDVATMGNIPSGCSRWWMFAWLSCTGADALLTELGEPCAELRVNTAVSLTPALRATGVQNGNVGQRAGTTPFGVSHTGLRLRRKTGPSRKLWAQLLCCAGPEQAL